MATNKDRLTDIGGDKALFEVYLFLAVGFYMFLVRNFILY